MDAPIGPLGWAFIALLGALWGSFSYTLALRIASGAFDENPLRALLSRSRCPSCGGAVSAIALVFDDMIPQLVRDQSHFTAHAVFSPSGTNPRRTSRAGRRL